ncbi:MAG TPA: hypothetical protein P5228_03655 [Bacteroidales bacterium]|nr:hypothetical protein [Bacteroidales bacterium]HRZ48756.1 hypothetical protein [Bacteroidales bacterium]
MKRIMMFAATLAFAFSVSAQKFEAPKPTCEFEGLKVKIGADFALQFQALDHSTGSLTDTLVTLGNNFNLPTANLNLNAVLADGVSMHLRTYLSARHHREAWVKGGHIMIDKLDFISDGFLSGVMKYTTLKVGLDEINYGDAHFRRTDNARAITNPFVGNYIMDAFTTEAFGEIYFRHSGALLMLGLSNGHLNQTVLKTVGTEDKVSLYGKLGYDRNFSDDFRVRLTGSFYANQGDSRKYLYGGDRGGSRYYSVLQAKSGAVNDFTGRFNPDFKKLTAIQINPFVKFKGAELFGVYEIANGSSGGTDDFKGTYNQLGVELLYRFGSDERFYVGGRYNTVSGKQTETSKDRKIQRINVGAGWFLTKNIITKLEYVQQTYSGDGWTGTLYNGKFNGVMLEAAISF